MTQIKICGLTSVADAEAALALGVEAIGINLWSGSKRRCDPEVARAIARSAEARARTVAILVDPDPDEIARARDLGIDWIQLHGDEAGDLVRAALPRAYKAIRASGEEGYRAALSAPGIELMLDASVAGQRGGTGTLADWSLAARIARARPLWLAGGLTADNVADAIAKVRPLGVDVASGVEIAPGVKDPAKLGCFVRAVRGALRPAE